jgi:hypothetical protein
MHTQNRATKKAAGRRQCQRRRRRRAARDSYRVSETTSRGAGAIGRFGGVGTKLRFSSRGKGTEASSIPCSPPWIDGVPGRPPSLAP